MSAYDDGDELPAGCSLVGVVLPDFICGQIAEMLEDPANERTVPMLLYLTQAEAEELDACAGHTSEPRVLGRIALAALMALVPREGEPG